MQATRSIQRMDGPDGPDYEAARRALVGLRESYLALRQHQRVVSEQLDVAVALIDEAERLLTSVQALPQVTARSLPPVAVA